LKGFEFTRAQLKQGSQGLLGGNGDDHFHEMTGSRDFVMYITPNKRAKGFAELKTALEEVGCEVRRIENDPLLPGKRYQAVKVTFKGETIPGSALQRVHRWAHQRNYLHSFFKPYVAPNARREAQSTSNQPEV
jgi:hypothetical protein